MTFGERESDAREYEEVKSVVYLGALGATHTHTAWPFKCTSGLCF